MSRRLRGCLVAEVAELRGLHTRDLDSIKAFITRPDETWVPKYREFGTTFPRRVIFIGTTNQREFLSDETGNRRFLPLRVGQCQPDKIEQDRDQLWAEGIARFREGGIAWQDAERLAHAEHGKFRIEDAWEALVHDWLHRPDMGFRDVTGGHDDTGTAPFGRPHLRLIEVFQGAITKPGKEISRPDEMRLGRVMQTFGYAKKRVMVDGERAWRWTRD